MLWIKLIIKYCVSCWITDIFQNGTRSIQHQINYCSHYFFWRYSPNRYRLPCFLVYRSHKHRQTISRSSMNEWSTRHRGRYLRNRQQTQMTDLHALSRIRTRDHSKEEAVNLRLRPHGHRYRFVYIILCYIMLYYFHNTGLLFEICMQAIL